MKTRKITALIILTIIINHNTSYTKSIEEIIKKANSFLKKSHSIQGNFELIENKKVHKGYFLFKQPQYLKMVFKDNKTIIFDGKSIWAYFPKMKIIIDQEINKENNALRLTVDSLDINYLTKHYHFFFKKGDYKLKSIKEINAKAHIIECAPKNDNYAFKKLFFYIRDDGFIVRSVGINYNGNVFTLTRKNLVINRKIDAKIFAKEIPKDAKIIKNPFTTGRSY